MVSRTRWLAAGVAAAGLMALPAVPMAQGTTGSSSSQSYGQSSAENKSPRYHLDQAKRILDELSGSSSEMGSTSGSTTGSATTGSGTTGSGTTGSGTTASGTTGSQSGSMTSDATDKASILSELRRHFTQLEQAYERSHRETTSGSTAGTTGSTTGTTGSGTTGSGTTGSTTGSSTEYGSQSETGDSWMTHYSRLNQVLDRINVPKSSTATGTSGSMSGTGTSGSTSGTGSGTTGSGTTGSGTTGSTSESMSQSGSSSLDASTMSKLGEFRMHLDNFHAAAMAEAAGRR